jgi:hypothetical protein
MSAKPPRSTAERPISLVWGGWPSMPLEKRPVARQGGVELLDERIPIEMRCPRWVEGGERRFRIERERMKGTAKPERDGVGFRVAGPVGEELGQRPAALEFARERLDDVRRKAGVQPSAPVGLAREGAKQFRCGHG